MPRRKATWALLIWTVLMALWIAGGISSASGDATNCGSLSQDACNAARGVGAGIGVIALFILWFLGFVVLGLIALLTRPPRRLCPSCGNEARKGITACKTCGFFFGGGPPANAYPGFQPGGSSMPTPAGQPQLSPDGMHYWDGQAWQPVASLPA